ncbi:secreted protein [Melampsora americana]|nr:secreted protein [Melampsora americana]
MCRHIIAMYLFFCLSFLLIQFTSSQLETTATNLGEFALEELEGLVTDRLLIGSGRPQTGVQRRQIRH